MIVAVEIWTINDLHLAKFYIRMNSAFSRHPPGFDYDKTILFADKMSNLSWKMSARARLRRAKTRKKVDKDFLVFCCSDPSQHKTHIDGT